MGGGSLDYSELSQASRQGLLGEGANRRCGDDRLPGGGRSSPGRRLGKILPGFWSTARRCAPAAPLEAEVGSGLSSRPPPQSLGEERDKVAVEFGRHNRGQPVSTELLAFLTVYQLVLCPCQPFNLDFIKKKKYYLYSLHGNTIRSTKRKWKPSSCPTSVSWFPQSSVLSWDTRGGLIARTLPHGEHSQPPGDWGLGTVSLERGAARGCQGTVFKRAMCAGAQVREKGVLQVEPRLHSVSTKHCEVEKEVASLPRAAQRVRKRNG